jgi:hypothetical protein
MSQVNHSALESDKSQTGEADPLVKLISFVPGSVRWKLKRFAADDQTTAGRLVSRVIEQYVASREGGQAA